MGEKSPMGEVTSMVWGQTGACSEQGEVEGAGLTKLGGEQAEGLCLRPSVA